MKDFRMSGCEDHDLTQVDCAAIRHDMYYKRPAIGIRIKSDLVRHEGDRGDGENPAKTFMSAAYFKSGSCMCTNFAVAQIYAPCFKEMSCVTFLDHQMTWTIFCVYLCMLERPQSAKTGTKREESSQSLPQNKFIIHAVIAVFPFSRVRLVTSWQHGTDPHS